MRTDWFGFGEATLVLWCSLLFHLVSWAVTRFLNLFLMVCHVFFGINIQSLFALLGMSAYAYPCDSFCELIPSLTFIYLVVFNIFYFPQ